MNTAQLTSFMRSRFRSTAKRGKRSTNSWRWKLKFPSHRRPPRSSGFKQCLHGMAQVLVNSAHSFQERRALLNWNFKSLREHD